jgi:capsular exopolysaccharide synthesis family protein
MSESFDLVRQRGRDSTAERPAGVTAHLPGHYPRRLGNVPDDMLAASLWRIIRDRKGTIAAFVLIVVTMVVTVSLLMKPQYEAVGRVVAVLHRDNDPGVLGFRGADALSLEDPEDRSAIDTQISILETDALALQVINTLQLDKNPKFTGRQEQAIDQDELVRMFHKRLKISKVKGTRLIEIRFRSSDAQLAADVVNGLAKEYVDEYYRSQFQASMQLSDFLAHQSKELRAKVETSQRRLLDYQKENQLLGLEDKQNIVTVRLSDLNRELTSAEDDRVRKEVNYRLAASGHPELLAQPEPDNLLTRLRGQQSDLESQIAQASVQLGPAHPRMAELSRQLAQVQTSIAAEVKRIGEHITNEYQAAVERERMLKDGLEAQKRTADKLNASAVQSDILKHEFETNRKLYEDLQQKQKEIAISASLKLSNIWIVDPARPPKRPVEPDVLRNAALSVLFGIFGGVLLGASLAKMSERTISSLEQAQSLSPLPALGALPLLEPKRKNLLHRRLPAGNGLLEPALVSLLEPMSPATESYKAVLTSLLLSQATPPEVIQITSALPGEGKTTVSTNLAILLARLRRRVLLVDADLRHPQVHLAAELRTNVGLGPLLRNSVKFDEAVMSWPAVPNLFILPAGSVILPDDTELLMWSFKDWVDRWRDQFDHIIIDSPPVLPVADAIRMSVEVDSVILVIRSGQIDRNAFLRAQDSLSNVNARVAGFVLNGAHLNLSEIESYSRYYGRSQTTSLRDGR